jgi:hypothetical protein
VSFSADLQRRLATCLCSVNAAAELEDEVTSMEFGSEAAFAAGASFDGGTGENVIEVPDNLADGLSIKQGANSYLTVVTTDSSEGLTVGQHLTVADGKNVILNTTTGTKIGTAVGQKLGFHNATPVAQRSGAAQAAVAETAATSSTPFGYAEAQANAIVTLVNELRAALVEKGIIKGSA